MRSHHPLPEPQVWVSKRYSSCYLTAAMPEPLRGRETEGSRASSELALLPSLMLAARSWDS